MLYLGFFMFIVVLYAVIFVYKTATRNNVPVQEHFTEPPSSSTQTEQPQDMYKARMNVMTVFDGYMKRKPTPEEIDKYSLYDNEQDILAALIKEDGKGIRNIPITTQSSTQSNQSNLHNQSKEDSIAQEEPYTQQEEFFVQQEEHFEDNITMPRDYVEELKKQLLRCERELGSFRKMLG